MRTLVSLFAGGIVGALASFGVMIFGPLIVPQSMGKPTLGENIVALSIPAFFLIFGAIGFFLARTFVGRRIDSSNDTGRRFT